VNQRLVVAFGSQDETEPARNLVISMLDSFEPRKTRAISRASTYKYAERVSLQRYDVDEGSGEVGRVGSEGYFTRSPLMVQCRSALGTDGQEEQLAVTFSPTA